MHILGLLVTLTTLLYLLDRLGVDIGGLNPFAWRRRRAWRQKFDANPIFSLSDPREIAAVLLVGVAKIDGDLTAEERQQLLDEFANAFSMSAKAASELLSSTVFLLGDMQVLNSQATELLQRYQERLAQNQIDSLLGMIERVASIGGQTSPQQSELVAQIRAALAPDMSARGTWD